MVADESLEAKDSVSLLWEGIDIAKSCHSQDVARTGGSSLLVH